MSLNLKYTDEFDARFWSLNLPLQVWRSGDESPHCFLNYMPRRERCCELEVSDSELPEFCQNTATILRNLATLFEMFGRGEIDCVYYPDEDPEQAVVDAAKDRTR